MKIKIIEKIFHKRELASLKAECDLLADAYNDLMTWAEYVSLKTPELKMIKDALEHRGYSKKRFIHSRLIGAIGNAMMSF